jgi:AcrR family transcriptional regulator
MSRAARRREQTRRDLLAASIRTLAARGYHQTKISDIATEADVGVGTFYLHYASKEALFLELVHDTARRLKATVDAAKARVAGPAAQARASCQGFFRFAHENRETFRILFGEGLLNKAIRDAQQDFIADVADNLAAGIRDGTFACYPPAVIAQAVIGMLTQVLSWWITQEAVGLDEVVEATDRFITSGLSPHGSPVTGGS